MNEAVQAVDHATAIIFQGPPVNGVENQLAEYNARNLIKDLRRKLDALEGALDGYSSIPGLAE